MLSRNRISSSVRVVRGAGLAVGAIASGIQIPSEEEWQTDDSSIGGGRFSRREISIADCGARLARPARPAASNRRGGPSERILRELSPNCDRRIWLWQPRHYLTKSLPGSGKAKKPSRPPVAL